MKKRIYFMNTAFRDGFQSVYGARVFTKDFLPALEAAREAGISHFEAGGGARFQSLYFYSNEDAFEMMDTFREITGKYANLQTLARGINVVGLDSQPRDIIELHAKLFKKHGMSTIRNFDALNDVNNLIFSGRCIAQAGLQHEICVTMMELPPGVKGAHSPEFYMKVLRNILDADIPFHSVCFKDASGTSKPRKVYDTIYLARKMLGPKPRIVFHTHETAGQSIICYKAAIEAGADQIDLSMAPVSGGTCQPDIITMWHALRDENYDLGIDIKKVIEAEEVLKECMSDYFLPPESKAVEPLIPFSPMPGGALTANTQMMRDNGQFHRYPEVAAAMSEAIVRGGFGTSVTPVSQFYFQQAYNNVMYGPWERIAEGYGKMVLGYFGKTPVPPHPEVIKLASKQLELEPTTESPIDINDRDESRGTDAAKKMLKAEKLPLTEENIFIAAACKEKGIAFLKGEGRVGVRKQQEKAEESPAAVEQKKEGIRIYSVQVADETFRVRIDGKQARIEGTDYQVSLDEIEENAETEQTGPEKETKREAVGIQAPLPGLVLKIPVNVGDWVQEGGEIIILESMKMETPVTATESGTVSEIPVRQGDQVKSGQIIMRIQKD
jgi:pyruvate carboxylase subunit B